jgi:hypothetical protein
MKSKSYFQLRTERNNKSKREIPVKEVDSYKISASNMCLLQKFIQSYFEDAQVFVMQNYEVKNLVIHRNNSRVIVSSRLVNAKIEKDNDNDSYIF